ncbi:hypothetical protein [Campylobacter troglodytis]|uniref:hypothetical protein n=1 Tax=Campylobacter troglodytis TaxID=654363 RepID=UPI00163C1D4B|nr:hypothetical protein [Campylobacter troglodytis]
MNLNSSKLTHPQTIFARECRIWTTDNELRKFKLCVNLYLASCYAFAKTFLLGKTATF